MNSPIEKIKSEKQLLFKKYVNERINSNVDLIDQNKDAILYVDLDGYVVKVNPAFETLTEYSAEEAMQLKKQKFFSLDFLDRVFYTCYKASLGRLQNFDCQIQTKPGLS